MPHKAILLVDDDEDDHEIFLAALQQVTNSVHCLTFHNPVQALNTLKKGEINPRLVFLDLNMPLLSGFEFLEMMKKDEKLTAIPVVILSTTSNKETIDKVKQAGAVDFITKPPNLTDLVQRLKEVTEQNNLL